MGPLVASLRPQEWIKNLLVFAGVIFSLQFDEGQALLDATITFVAFCGISSAGYLFNDLRDREHDRLHPDKRHRPVPRSARPRTAARGVALAFWRSRSASRSRPRSPGFVALYRLVTAALDRPQALVILDVMTISGLFILRVVAGAVAVDAKASSTCSICTAMLALFLGFASAAEAILEETRRRRGATTRPVLERTRCPSSTR